MWSAVFKLKYREENAAIIYIKIRQIRSSLAAHFKMLFAVSQVTGFLSWIVRSWTDVENNIVSVERVKEYADTPKEVSVAIQPNYTAFVGQ